MVVGFRCGVRKRPVMAAFFAGALCSGLGYFVQSQGSRALILLMG